MIKEITDIVSRAASLMMKRDFAIEQKDGLENIVTTSDLAVQEFLCRELGLLLPGSRFLCEESLSDAPSSDAAGENACYTWIVDPIDGTANYSRGIDHCAISVALKKDDRLEMGVVYSPARKEMYTAVRGQGAFCNGEPIHVSDRSFKNGLFCTAMSTYRKEFAGVCNDIIMETYLQCNDLRRFGAASVELCFLAAGYCELYFEMRLQPWDYAAGMLILQEAGGCISHLDGALPRLDGIDLVLAANSAVNHSRLLKIVQKHIPAMPYTD